MGKSASSTCTKFLKILCMLRDTQDTLCPQGRRQEEPTSKVVLNSACVLGPLCACINIYAHIHNIIFNCFKIFDDRFIYSLVGTALLVCFSQVILTSELVF